MRDHWRSRHPHISDGTAMQCRRPFDRSAAAGCRLPQRRGWPWRSARYRRAPASQIRRGPRLGFPGLWVARPMMAGIAG